MAAIEWIFYFSWCCMALRVIHKKVWMSQIFKCEFQNSWIRWRIITFARCKEQSLLVIPLYIGSEFKQSFFTAMHQWKFERNYVVPSATSYGGNAGNRVKNKLLVQENVGQPTYVSLVSCLNCKKSILGWKVQVINLLFILLGFS